MSKPGKRPRRVHEQPQPPPVVIDTTPEPFDPIMPWQLSKLFLMTLTEFRLVGREHASLRELSALEFYFADRLKTCFWVVGVISMGAVAVLRHFLHPSRQFELALLTGAVALGTWLVWALLLSGVCRCLALAIRAQASDRVTVVFRTLHVSGPGISVAASMLYLLNVLHTRLGNRQPPPIQFR